VADSESWRALFCACLRSWLRAQAYSPALDRSAFWRENSRDLGSADHARGHDCLRAIVRRLKLPPALSNRLGLGFVALILLLAAEFTLVLWLRGLLMSEYLASRDPVSGTVC
jgi:hypothetical protein